MPGAASAAVAAVPALAAGPTHSRPGFYDTGFGQTRWWDGAEWSGPTLPTSTVPRKSTGLAYVFLIFLGGFGSHRIYLRAFVSAGIMLALWITALVSIIVSLALHDVAASYITGYAVVVLWVWMFADLFMLPSMVRHANHKFAHRAFASAEEHLLSSV